MANTIEQLYTCGIAGQAVTLTPKAGAPALPSHLGASTVVFNTTANPAPTEFWATTDEYVVIVRRRTKTTI
jgi:hypothetical protein